MAVNWFTALSFLVHRSVSFTHVIVVAKHEYRQKALLSSQDEVVKFYTRAPFLFQMELRGS